MGRYTREALRFVVGISLLAVAATVVGIITGSAGTQANWTTCGLLAVLAAISHLYPVKSAKKGVVYDVANAFLFAGVMLLPQWQLIILNVVALLPVTIKNISRPGAGIRSAFNVAQSTLACQAAWTAIRLGHVQGLTRPADMAFTLVALVIFVAVQLLAVAQVVAYNHKTSLLKTQIVTLEAVMADTITPFFGAIMSVLWYEHPWVVAFSAIPMILAYRLMRQVQLVTMADLDPKTGLYNFRYFQEAAQEELRRSSGLRRPVSILFCDLDYLREVNNTYGHLAGDKVLDQIAVLLTKVLPSSATISRFGGEEFVAMLPGTDSEEAFVIAERLRLSISNHPFDIGLLDPIRVTLCVGISCAPTDGANLSLLAECADKALYAAKNAGRNRVCVWRGEPVLVEEQDAPQPTESAPPAPAPEPPVTVPQASPMPAPASAAGRPLPGPSWQMRADWDRLAIIFGGVAVLVASLGRLPANYPWPLLLACLASGIVAEFLDVPLLVSSRHAATVSPAVAVGLAAGALLGPSGAVIVAVGSASVHALRHGSGRPIQHFFNVALAVLANATAGLILSRAGLPEMREPTFFHLMIGVAATAAYFVINTGVLTIVVARHSHRPCLQVWWESFGWLAPQFVLTGLTGIVAIHLYRDYGLAGVAVGAILTLLAYFSVNMSVSGHRKALEESRRVRKKLEEEHEQERRTTNEWVRILAGVIDARDGSVAGHSEKVAYYSAALASEMGLAPDAVEAVSLAALLHDLGKVGVPEAILSKPSRLSPDEWAVMKQHPALGERLLSQVAALSGVARMVGEHHERYDGLGYPYGRRGAEISLGARIIALCDALDTMLTGRPYSSPRPPARALDELEACAGKQFDPAVVEALGRLLSREGAEFLQSPPSQAERAMQGA